MPQYGRAASSVQQWRGPIQESLLWNMALLLELPYLVRTISRYDKNLQIQPSPERAC